MAEAASPSAGATGVKTMADDKHFVDKHQVELIKRVSNIAPILDELFDKNVILKESYDEIRALHTSQEKMRALFSGPLESSGVKGKEIFYKTLNENEPYLIADLKRTEVQVETMTAKKMLSETLNDLSSEELNKFKSLIKLEKGFPLISRSRLKVANTQDIVELMVETYSQECVELTKKVLKKLNRTDLVQRLSDISSGTKQKHSVDKQQSALIQRVETMASVIELLLETLADLTDGELKNFKEVLLSQIHFHRRFSDISWMRLETTDRQDTVFLMVLTYGQQSVEMIKKVLKKMKRTDLVQRLSESSSGPKKKHSVDERRSALIQKVATMAAVKQMLLETLNDLSNKKLKKFKEFLQLIVSQKKLPSSWMLRNTADSADAVDQMVQSYGQQSVELTREVLKKMNRTDLMQRLSKPSSGLKEKHSVDEHRPALFERAAAKAAVNKILLETLNDLSYKEQNEFKWLLQFTYFQKSLLQMPLSQLERADILVELMMEIHGQQSVEVTKEVFMDMNRTDLVQRLSETSSGLKEKHQSKPFQKEVTMTSVKEKLLETLQDLSYGELEKFKWLLQFTFFQRGLPHISWGRLQEANRADLLVDVMVESCGQQSVEVTMEVFMDMNRTDLVQRLSETRCLVTIFIKRVAAAGSSAEAFEKHSVDEHWPALIQKVETMASVIELLLETLADLSHGELKKFKKVLLSQIHFHRRFSHIPWMRLEITDRQDTVFLMVLTYGQKSVETTREVLKNMKRTDLVQRLSESSSGSKKKHSADERRSALIQKVATMAAVKQLLLETLKDLSYEELEKFKEFLQLIVSKKDLPDITWMLRHTADSADTVDLMVQSYGQQSVELTREVLKKMNRTDLMQRLSKPSSGLKVKHSVDEHRPALLEREVTMTSLKEKLLETLGDLSYGEVEQFKWLLQYTKMKKGLPRIPRHRMEMADRVDIVELMVEIYGQQSVEVTREVLKKMNRSDLVQRLSDISSGSKGPSRSLELEGCGSMMQDSSDWTKLEPEVNSTDTDEAPTYSLQSEAGNFECSVSDLRWVCKEQVSFKYQFFSWEEHMERMESIKYMPAGPLIDIKVIAGKLHEVYLPHWICIDDNPKISDKFAVLHIDDCGDVVEKASEVTPSHVKLSEPVFSPRAVLMKAGFSVKINCKVLIYKTNTSFLTLHVYLIPRDPGLQQAMDKRESSYGYNVIRKPHPEKSLKMRDRFILTADLDGAEIYPEKLKLRYESRDPNFFEVFIENPDRNFTLKLTQKNELQPVWTCVIRKDEYQSTGHIQGEHFVDKHQCDLIERVSNIGPILDNLLTEGVIQQEGYDTIGAIPTTQEKMRKLYSGPLKAGGHPGKDIFYKILEEKESYLVADLKRKEL